MADEITYKPKIIGKSFTELIGYIYRFRRTSNTTREILAKDKNYA